MKLKEWNYELGPSGGFVDADYPDELIAPFVEFFRKTSLWHNNMDVIEEKVLTLQRNLTEHRNKVSQAAADAEDAVRAEAEAQALESRLTFTPDGIPNEIEGLVPRQKVKAEAAEAALAKEIDELGEQEEEVEPVIEGGFVQGAAASLSDRDKEAAGLKPISRYPTKKVPGLDPSPLG